MDTVDELLTRAAPPATLTPSVTSALDDLGSALPSMLRPADLVRARRRRRRQRILTGAAGLALLASATPAAASHLGLHTGLFGDDGGHYGELLNLGSPEAIPVLRKYEQEYPLPAGGSWAVLEQRWQSPTNAMLQGQGQAGILEEAAGLESQCQWEGSWLSAHAGGDARTAATAVRVLAEIPTWHVITAYDADGGMVTQARQVAEGAARGDTTLPQQDFSVNCTDVRPGT